MAIRLIESNTTNFLIDDNYTDNDTDNIFESLDLNKSVNVSVKQAGRGSISFFIHSEKSGSETLFARWFNIEIVL